MQWGLISKVDSETLMKTADLICEQFPSESIEFTEIGLYGGLTGNSLNQYFTSKKVASWWTGIDNFKDNEKLIHVPDKLITGNSSEVYNQLEDNSQHLLIIDGNHSFPYVVSDIFCYKDKVKKGGFLCLHDAAPQAQGLDWQRMGDEKDPDMSISVLKAIKEVSLWETDSFGIKQWELTFHEWDINDRCGGFAIFKKLY